MDRLVGLLLAVAAIVSLAFMVGTLLVAGEAQSVWASAAAACAALVVFLWCTKTSWRLITGRRRQDGGLLSPWLVGAAGVGFATWAVFGVAEGGYRGAGGVFWFACASLACFALANERLKRRR